MSKMAWDFLNNLFSADVTVFLKPLAIAIVGIAIYSLFIFNFYRFVARKTIFKLDLAKYNTSKYPLLNKFFVVIFYIFENIIFIPLFVFLWFLIFAVLFAFLSKNSNTETILLISGALVGAIRLTAYYSEDLSKDLAKLIPFALLGIFLVDISYFSLSDSISRILGFAAYWRVTLYYLLFIIALEFVLTLFFGFLKLIGISFGEEKEED